MTRSDTRFTVLLRGHSPHRSTSELGRAIGENLPAKLRYARGRHQLPDGKLLAKIAGELDEVGRAMLVDALAWDARLPGYDVEDEPVQRRFSRAIRRLSPDMREAILRLLEVSDVDARSFQFASEILDDGRDEEPVG